MKKKKYSVSSWHANFEDMKKQTGLKTWQVYAISSLLFVVSVAIMLIFALAQG